MKKIFLIAASAMMVLASCTKVVINYPEDAQPQEIAMFAVNKSATKAPVGKDSSFPTDYDMMVAAYLASGDLTANGGNGDYFDRTLFTHNNGIWSGGKYWPVSTSTLNFLAVAVPKSSNSAYTGSVSNVTFGTAVESTPTPSAATKAESYENFASKVVVTFSGNETRQAKAASGNDAAVTENYNQFDLMYAAGQGVHNEGGAYDNVNMLFKHALSWINFTVATNVSCSLKVNSIRVSKASYGGTMTLTNQNFASTTSTDVQTDDYSISWTAPVSANDVYVPGALSNSTVSIAGEVTAGTTATAFGNGLLVVPVDYLNVGDGGRPTITINYTMNQGGGAYTFERTIEIPKIKWEPNKKYTYALTITLNEIKVDPKVEKWDDKDEKGTENDTTDDVNWGAEVPLD